MVLIVTGLDLCHLILLGKFDNEKKVCFLRIEIKLIQFFSWSLRVKSVKFLYDSSNYTCAKKFFAERTVDPEVDATVCAKAAGFEKILDSFEFYFIITIIIEIFEVIEILNIELQKKELCVNESDALVKVVIFKVERMRDQKIFDDIWNETTVSAKNLKIKEP